MYNLETDWKVPLFNTNQGCVFISDAISDSTLPHRRALRTCVANDPFIWEPSPFPLSYSFSLSLQRPVTVWPLALLTL